MAPHKQSKSSPIQETSNEDAELHSKKFWKIKRKLIFREGQMKVAKRTEFQVVKKHNKEERMKLDNLPISDCKMTTIHLLVPLNPGQQDVD
ncbi:hypothetical protein TNCV_939451 [Trichonephila clavipes]|nr:hypothetical protein TNCV_939451 [Trichonephila clavipes]